MRGDSVVAVLGSAQHVGRNLSKECLRTIERTIARPGVGPALDFLDRPARPICLRLVMAPKVLPNQTIGVHATRSGGFCSGILIGKLGAHREYLLGVIAERRELGDQLRLGAGLQFFVKLNAAAAIEQFEPREFVGDADTVVALGFWSGKSKTAGKPFSSDWSMTWKFKNDKVAYYQAFLDTTVS